MGWRQVSSLRWERTDGRGLVAAVCRHLRGYWYAYSYGRKPPVMIDKQTAEEAMAAIDEALSTVGGKGDRDYLGSCPLNK